MNGGSTADEEEFMAKKPAAKKSKKVSLGAIRKAIKGVKKKVAKVKTPKAKALSKKLTKLDAAIPCGQGLFVDIS